MSSPQIENGYTKIANEIIERFSHAGINGSEYRILFVVIRKTYGFNKKVDRISISQFQLFTQMEHKQAVETIKSLVNKKILIKDGSKYTFNKNWEDWVVGKRPLPDSQWAKDHYPSGQKPTKSSGQKPTNKRKKETNTKESSNYFEIFYTAYPRKVGKADALKAFNKVDQTLLPTLLNALEKHKRTKQWQDKSFIPHPATWLNKKRWEDEVDTTEIKDEMELWALECVKKWPTDVNDNAQFMFKEKYPDMKDRLKYKHILNL